MPNPPDREPRREPRRMWRVWLFAAALAVNLFATGILVRNVLAGGDFTAQGLLGTALAGVFAALLLWELRKPRA